MPKRGSLGALSPMEIINQSLSSTLKLAVPIVII